MAAAFSNAVAMPSMALPPAMQRVANFPVGQEVGDGRILPAAAGLLAQGLEQGFLIRAQRAHVGAEAVPLGVQRLHGGGKGIDPHVHFVFEHRRVVPVTIGRGGGFPISCGELAWRLGHLFPGEAAAEAQEAGLNLLPLLEQPGVGGAVLGSHRPGGGAQELGLGRLGHEGLGGRRQAGRTGDGEGVGLHSFF